MGSGATIYTPSLIKIDLGIQKLMEVENSQTLRLHGYLINLLLFFGK
jgi:hypothetical protein